MFNRSMFPHQLEFLEEMSQTTDDVVLVAPPGSGMHATFAALSARVAGAHARVLHIVPSQLLAMVREQLKQAVDGISEIAVLDRSTRRALEPFLASSSPAGPTIVVTSIDYAKTKEIAFLLSSTTSWSLVIVHDGSKLRGAREQLVAALRASRAIRRVVVGLYVVCEKPASLVSARTIEWRRESLRLPDGTPLFGRRETSTIAYRRSPAEIAVIDAVEAVTDAIHLGGPTATRMMSAAASSTPALEETLLALREKTLVETSTPNDMVVTTIERALAAIDALDTDSKIGALKDTLKNLFPDRRVVVITSYVRTLLYLEAALSAAGLSVIAVHGGLGQDEREHAFERFVEVGNVLIVTEMLVADSRHRALRASVVVNYDLPSSPSHLEERWALVDRPGGDRSALMLRLVDASGRSRFEDTLEMLTAKSRTTAEPQNAPAMAPAEVQMLPERWRVAFEHLFKSAGGSPPERMNDGTWVQSFEWVMTSAGNVLAALPGQYDPIAGESVGMVDNSGEEVDTESESHLWACDEERALFQYTDHWQAGLSGTVLLLPNHETYVEERERRLEAFVEEGHDDLIF